MASFLLRTLLLLLSALSLITSTLAFNLSSSQSINAQLSSIKTVCKSTPYPDVCFKSLKLSISININPNILNFLLQSLQTALSESAKVSNLLSDARASSIVEKQRGSIQDCKELHEITLTYLKKSVSHARSSKKPDVNAYLSAALTNKNTCLEGLDQAYGSFKPVLVSSIVSAYKHVSNSLSILSRSQPPKPLARRRLLVYPAWLSRRDRRIVDSNDDYKYEPGSTLMVAVDGSGNFSTISDAISFAPNNSLDRVFIYVEEGVYEENVVIPSYKTNIVMLGDGADSTVIRGSRSVGDGWTTFRSATLAVSGEGFIMRDITIENTAGPEKHQAVALRVNADFVAIYRCTFDGYQDTLYPHSFRQFYRECDIFGTVDFIFGNAAAVFQGCDIVAKRPMPGQFNAITAQSRDDEFQDTGFSIQNCSILATDDLLSAVNSTKSYLGRPWKDYSRTVIMESYIDGFINPAGWTKWSEDTRLDTLYYGEYMNDGPGSATENRVQWDGFHVMDYNDALSFTVSNFITSDEWLESTAVPFDDGI